MTALHSLPILKVKTNSELSCWRGCPQKHQFRYVQLRRTRDDSDALSFGSGWHVGQEAWWKNVHEPVEIRLFEGLTAMRAAEWSSPFALVMAEELLIGYSARWGDLEYTTLCVEQAFEIPLINPETGHPSRTFRIGGKFDGIIADAKGQLVLEHKTSGGDIESGSLYWKKIRTLDTQVSLYLSGARELGFEPRACLFDVVRKLGIRPLKATPVESRKYLKGTTTLYAHQREYDETPEEYRARVRAEIEEKPERYFQREEIVRLNADDKSHSYDMWSQTRMMREAELAGFSPKNPDNCSAYGGCEYLSVCCGEADINDDSLFRTAETAHEELEG